MPENKQVREKAPMKGRRHFATRSNMVNSTRKRGNLSTAVSYTCDIILMQEGKDPAQGGSTEPKEGLGT
jgi:hypothetical protein